MRRVLKNLYGNCGVNVVLFVREVYVLSACAWHMCSHTLHSSGGQFVEVMSGRCFREDTA